MFESYDGFIHFNPDKWRQKMRSLTLTELQEEEVTMIRYRHGDISSIVISMFEGVLVPGTGLFSGIKTTRQLIVAQKKLVIIRAELASRGQPLHEKNWHDYFIPMIMVVLGSTVAEMISVDLSSILPHISLPGSSIAQVEAIATNTSSSMTNFFHGIVDPTEQLYNQAAQGLSHLQVSVPSLTPPGVGTDSSLANLADFHTGIKAGSDAAEQGGSLAITSLVDKLTSKLETFDKKKKAKAQADAKPEIQPVATVAMPNAFDMSHMHALGVPTGIVVYS